MPITSVAILHICNLWILLKKIEIYLIGRKFHLHRLFAVKVDVGDVTSTQKSVKSFHIDRFLGLTLKKVYEDEIFGQQDILQLF